MSTRPMADISSSRLVNAGVELVWELWSKPEHLAKWWGPRGFRNTISRHEFKQDGEWHLTMHGPDGTDYPNVWIYREIILHSKLVIEHGNHHPKFTAIVRFEPEGERTWVYFDMYFDNPEVVEAIKDVAILGNEQNLERLEEAIAARTGVVLPKAFLMTRTFNTSAETMWEMWTNPEHMSKWWGPSNVSVAYSKMDFRRGGFYHYAQVDGNGNKMWGKMRFKDILPHKRLLFINCFSDEEGNIGSHPMAPLWPKELLSTITFDEKDGKTTVTIEWYPVNATPEEIKCFNEGHESMTQGWGSVLDKLEEAVR